MQIRKPGDVCLFIMVCIDLNIMHKLKVCMLNVLQVDLTGFVIWCGSIEFVGRTSKCNQGYKMDLNFIDEEVMSVCV